MCPARFSSLFIILLAIGATISPRLDIHQSARDYTDFKCEFYGCCCCDLLHSGGRKMEELGERGARFMLFKGVEALYLANAKRDVRIPYLLVGFQVCIEKRGDSTGTVLGVGNRFE